MIKDLTWELVIDDSENPADPTWFAQGFQVDFHIIENAMSTFDLFVVRKEPEESEIRFNFASVEIAKEEAEAIHQTTFNEEIDKWRVEE